MPSLAEWIGIYGAILSSGLAIWELTKGRRQVLVIVEYAKEWVSVNVVVTNTGHRPITVRDVEASIQVDRKAWKTIQLYPPAFDESEEIFPKKLEDGESISLAPNNVAFRDHLLDGKGKHTRIGVFDSEGRTHRRVIYRKVEY